MEDGSIVNFGDPAFVAQLILLIDTMVPLPRKQDLKNPLGPVVVRPFSRMCWMGWKNLSWADPLAPIPPGEHLFRFWVISKTICSDTLLFAKYST